MAFYLLRYFDDFRKSSSLSVLPQGVGLHRRTNIRHIITIIGHRNLAGNFFLSIKRLSEVLEGFHYYFISDHLQFHY